VCEEKYESYPDQEICRCGIHFGYEDTAGGNDAKRVELYAKFREAWIANGEAELSKDQIRDSIAKIINA